MKKEQLCMHDNFFVSIMEYLIKKKSAKANFVEKVKCEQIYFKNCKSILAKNLGGNFLIILFLFVELLSTEKDDENFIIIIQIKIIL